MSDPYRIGWSAEASRQMDRLAKLAPRAVGPIVEFCYGRLRADPRRVGRALTRELAGRHSAHVGPYRVVYRIDDDAGAIIIERVDHRSDVYRRR